MNGKIRILYVDDEPGLLEIGKLFLEAGGEFEVDTLTSAKAALEQLKTGRYDAIVSDYLMPEMDGLEFLKQVRLHHDQVPFILFTGRGREEVVILALNNGADFYLQKGGEPVSQFTELSHKINQAVHRKRSEGALRESEATLRTIFLAAPVGIGLVSNRVLIRVNEQFSEITGDLPGDVTGKSARILYPTEEEFERVGREKYEQIRKYGTGTIETRWQRKDGTIRDILLSSTPLDPSDPGKGVTFTALDITERKEAEEALRKSEEKFRYLVENALEPVLILDFEGKILFANNAVTKLAGVGDYPGLSGRNVMDFIAPESREDVIRDFTRVSRDHDALPAHYQVITANGKKITIECIGQLVTYEGRPADLLSIRDITQSRQHEEVVRQKNLMLATINELQREFAELPAGMRVEEMAVKKLSSLSGAIVTMFSTYDPVDQVLTVSSMEYATGILESLPGAMETLTRWLGRSPEDMQMPLSHETYRDINRSIVGIKKTVAEMSYGCISPFIGASIQKLSGIDHFIHIAHVIDGELYGISVMGLKPGQPDPSGELLESFAHMVAVSLRRQRAEAGLVESEERLRSFVGQALEGVSIVDEGGRIIEWNPAQEKITGISRADAIGVCAWDLATRMIPDPHRRGEIRSRMEESVKLTIKSGISTHPDPIYYTFHRPDGTTAIAKQTVFIVKTSHGHMIGTLNQDVTTEKRADEKTKESEELLRQIIEKNPMSIQIVDREGFTLQVNPAHTRLFGAVPPADFSIFTDLVDKHPEFEECISRVKRGESVNLPDIQYNVHDTLPEYPHAPVWIRASIFPLHDKDGKPDRFVFMHENITGQKQAEEALHGSRQFLEAILNNVPARVFWKDKNLTYLGCNPAFARDAGFEKPEDVIGKDDYAMGWRKQAELYRDDDRRVIESGDAILLIEEPQTTPSGEKISLLTSKVPLRDEAGTIIGVLGTYLDVTERKQAAEELKESEVSYRGLFNTIQQALYLLDREGKFVDVNCGAEQMYGYAREEFVGRTPEFLSAPGKNDLPAVLEKIRKAFAGEPQKFEFWGLRKNGEEFPKDVHLYKGTYFGEDVVLAIGADITERRLAENALRESENRFATMFRSNPVSMTLVSALDGTFVDVNDAFVACSGYTREDVTGRTSGELGIFTDPQEYEQLVSRLQSTRHVDGMEMQIREKTGRVRTCRFSSGIILMGGKPYILSTIEDITDRKNAESAFRTMTESMVGATGIGSLDRITESIWSWLGADCIMIGEIQPDRKHVNVLSMLLDGKKTEDYSYTLEGTPCENTAGKGFCMYPDNAQDLFPKSRDLRELNIRGYAGTPLRDAEGKTMGVLCILTRKPLVLPPDARKILDIIAVKAAAEIGRRRSDEALRESEEILSDIIEKNPMSIQIVDREGFMLRVNPAFIRLFGSVPPPDFSIIADLVKSHPEIEELISQVKSGKPVNLPDMCFNPHDIYPELPDVPTRLRAIIFPLNDRHGKPQRFIFMHEDITEQRRAEEELRESEEKFRSLVEYSLDAILVLDLQGTILLANKAAATLVEAGEGAMLAGRNVMEFIAPESREDVMKDFMQVAKGHDAYLAHYTVISEKGNKTTVESIGKVISYEGRPADLVSLRDVTERMRAEEALRQANRKLNLLSGITRHDLKNQLLTLNGFLEISKKYPGDAAKMLEFIEKERKVVKTMERQIAFMKEYEAIGVNAPVWQDCRTLIETAAKQVLTGTITVNNDMPAGSEVFADPLIVKVCYNLMDNAVRHGGKITTIRFFGEERDGDHIIVCEDDGAGIPAEEKEQVFERGFGKNTGMGLFLSAEILSITGITLRETGEPGKGARFEITVPKGAWRITTP